MTNETSRPSFFVNTFIWLLILANVIAIMLESESRDRLAGRLICLQVGTGLISGGKTQG
jgi:hypothetical protein